MMALLVAAPRASAEPADRVGSWELGGLLGARVFSSQSALGAVEGSRASIANTAVLGVRLGRRIIMPQTLGAAGTPGTPRALRPPWVPGWIRSLALEGELPLALSGARDSDESAAIAVFEPRAHLRLSVGAPASTEPLVEPFAVLGLGFPIALSSKRYIVDSDIGWDVYAGAGVRFERSKGWSVRADLRALVVPARGTSLVSGEFEISVSLYRALGQGRATRGPHAQEAADGDRDQIPDSADACPTRAEDRDRFEDEDGCPDIDDDRDEVLDVVDRCRRDPETANGYRDLDGCPDELPEELLVLVPDARVLLFNSGSARLRRVARVPLRRVARLLAKHGSVRLLIIGHTDGREAPDTSHALSLQRAEAVRDFLIAQGVSPRRLEVWGSGAGDPVDRSGSARGRLRNRRVVLQIRLPGAPASVQAGSALAPEPEPEPEPEGIF